ncbi:MAG: bifunctional molybdenum cofactor biosynthesis protein MoaC/MoaB [Elusimicrobia bacterium RIFCSPHIGHO2_02_FULL_57_9]|nr:MAG: bifunctional molybdenum cofactor biosynthesis protein MoaC/MoaB [Elusimicrobia bacterium RIFCSPHIGHO2_02_FULL_57_9]
METQPISHLSAGDAHYRMIHVGDKTPTFREAQAQGSIQMGEKAFYSLTRNELPKGNAMALAEAAGIMAAKKTSDLLPLCHPLALDQVKIQCIPDETRHAVLVSCTASAYAKTGVEMEALIGVTHALLCLYDLIKGIDPVLTLSQIKLVYKRGGRSGHWVAPDAQKKPGFSGIRAAVVTISDRVFRQEMENISGPLLANSLGQLGATVVRQEQVPDEQTAIAQILTALANEVELIITTGGTGLSPRDVTPETINRLCDRIIPGIGERLRSLGAQNTAMACLSRSVGGLIGKTLVIALPGSQRAVIEGLSILEKLVPHALHIARGGNHE